MHGLVNGFAPFARRKFERIALIGETLGDVREVMIDGPSGIATIARPSTRSSAWSRCLPERRCRRPASTSRLARTKSLSGIAATSPPACAFGSAGGR
ncbi:hypothetical protein [Mesorhizobium xinjiangense]